jgi:hypothetical protein
VPLLRFLAGPLTKTPRLAATFDVLQTHDN